jgi:hypothetical protein
MTQTNQANQRSFLASIQKLTESTHTADFYIMNCSVNRNNWKVTKQALEEASPTIKKAPLGLGKDYKTGHYPDEESINIGKFTAYEQKGNYLQATATIEDPKAWNMMKNGELAAVSVVITVYRENCSLCGENLAELQEHWREHPCIKSGKACSQIESFKFHRVDFVDDPAYPQAGVQEMSAQADVSQPLRLYAAYYESQGDASNKPSVLGEQTMSETPQDKKIAALEAANKEWQEKAEASAAEVAALKAQLEAIQKAQHEALVAEVLAARKEAGLADQCEAKEKEMLTAQTDAVLQIMKTDAQKTAAKLQAATENPPKAQFGAATANTNEVAEAVKKQRASFGFTTKNTETSEDE